MNHLFWNITWLSYVELLTAILVVYYSYVALRWYRTDIAKRLQGDRPAAEIAGQGNQPSTTDDVQSAEGIHAQTEPGPNSPPQADMLTMALLATIAESSGHPYEPLATAQKLKAIICHYPELKNSPRRAAINRLVAAECNKTGIARLSEQEVDMWWDG